MNSKNTIYHLLIRIGILTLIIGVAFLFWYLTFDPHKYCDGEKHRHVDVGLGLAISILMVVSVYYIGLFVEMVYLFTKNRKNLAFTNFGILIISLLLALTFMCL